MGLSVALALLVTLWVFIDAVSFGWALGAAAVAFLGFALIVPGGSVLVYWSRFGGTQGRALGAKGYPVVVSLLLGASGLSEIDLERCSSLFSGELLALCETARAQEETWVNFKLFGMMGLTLAFVIAQAFYLARHVRDDEAQETA